MFCGWLLSFLWSLWFLFLFGLLDGGGVCGVCIKIFKAREIGLKRVVFIRFTK